MSGSHELTKMLAMAMVLGEGDLYIDGKYVAKVKGEGMFEKGKRMVKRREICPICGKKNVNIYRNSRGTWMCRECKEMYP